MNRRGGSGTLATMVLSFIGMVIGLALASYASGDFNPGIWVGMAIGWAIGLLLVHYLRRHP